MFTANKKTFRPGVDRILYAQAVYHQEEINAVVNSLKNGWLGPGKITQEFEVKVAKIFGKKYGLFVNSGSSANLIAIEIANLPPGSEVITQACTFPTTLNPIIHKGLIPVFVDSQLGTYNIDPDKIERAISKKTRAIFISHILGNVNDMEKIAKICKKNNFLFIEDSCDTIGSSFNGTPTGFYSDITTASFYAPHHITTAGAGGMIMTHSETLIKEAKVLRDWGRALPENDDKNINERFKFKVQEVDYDGKFTFTKIGYNFKPIEIQAAFGLVQLKKLSHFNKIRARNSRRLYEFFDGYPDHFILPEIHPKAEVYWLAFPLTIKTGSPINRKELLTYLEKHNIQIRLVFTGNILYHEAYKKIKFRISGNLKNANLILEQSFLIGCHHAMTDEMVDYMLLTFKKYFDNLNKKTHKSRKVINKYPVSKIAHTL